MKWFLVFIFAERFTLNHGLMNHLNGASSWCHLRPLRHHSSTELTANANCLNRLHASEAAAMIRNAYDEEKIITLITSDASRGSKKLSGLACVIRQIGKEKDRITIATRRIQSFNAKNIVQSEVGALDFGISIMMAIEGDENLSFKDTKSLPEGDIILITDSNSVIDHFSIAGDKWIDSKQKILLLDSSNRRIYLTKVKSNKSELDGFFDHDLADILCSLARNIPNKEMIHFYSDCDAHTSSLSADGKYYYTYTVDAPHLQQNDLDWLSSSEDPLDDKQSNRIYKQVILKRERGLRLERCKMRAQQELGLNIP